MAEASITIPIYKGGTIEVYPEFGIIKGPNGSYYDASINTFTNEPFTSITGVKYDQLTYGEDGQFTASYKDGKIYYTSGEIIVNIETGEVRNCANFKIGRLIIEGLNYPEPMIIYRPVNVYVLNEYYTLVQMRPGDRYFIADGVYRLMPDLIYTLQGEYNKYIVGSLISNGAFALYCSEHVIRLRTVKRTKCENHKFTWCNCNLFYFNDTLSGDEEIPSEVENKRYIKICSSGIKLMDEQRPGQCTKAALANDN